MPPEKPLAEMTPAELFDEINADGSNFSDKASRARVAGLEALRRLQAEVVPREQLETPEAFASTIYGDFDANALSFGENFLAKVAARVTARDELIRAEGRERIAALEAYDELRRHRVSVGLAQQGLHMARAACEALGLDFEDTAPVDITDRVASLEAQLATAREGALREVLADLQRYDDELLAEALIGAANPGASTRARERSVVLACMQRLRKLLTSPPPRVDGWIPAFPVERLASGRYAVLLECGDCDVAELNDLGWRTLHGFKLKGQHTPILCCGPLPDLPDSMPPSQPDAGTESK